MYRVYEELKAALGENAAKALTETMGGMFEELRNAVTKDDFRRLGESIDANVSRLDAAITGLTEAQTRTETRVGDLAGAQARTELRVEELAGAQARTELRVGELAGAQARTELRVGELAGAQART